MHEASKDKAQSRPNILSRSVARLGISIRLKLLVAFLASTSLMIALALFGLSALQQSNDRTKMLLRDQDRIAPSRNRGMSHVVIREIATSCGSQTAL